MTMKKTIGRAKILSVLRKCMHDPSLIQHTMNSNRFRSPFASFVDISSGNLVSFNFPRKVSSCGRRALLIRTPLAALGVRSSFIAHRPFFF